MEMTSSVAAIKAQIEAEYEAANRALFGLAQGTARHDFITAKMEAIGAHQARLSQLVGEEQAIAIVYEVFSQ